MGVNYGLAALENGARRHSLGLEQVHSLIVVPLQGPRGDNLVQVILVLAPSFRAFEPSVPGQLWAF